jgi:hypothetical protein
MIMNEGLNLSHDRGKTYSYDNVILVDLAPGVGPGSFK